MEKSFEKTWKEYTEYCRNEYIEGDLKGTWDDIAEMELMEQKEDFMHFYCYLKLKEEI